MNQRKLEFAPSLCFSFVEGRVRLHIGYIQKGVIGGTSRFEALINRCSQEVSNEDYYSAQEIMHHFAASEADKPLIQCRAIPHETMKF